MKFLLLIISVLSAAAHSQPQEASDGGLGLWELFKIEHVRDYGSEKEENERRKIFLENLKFVRDHNTKYLKGEVTFDVEINRFSDLTAKEFAATMNAFKRPANWIPSGEVYQEPADLELPSYVDWRKKGAVTPVKDQGHCSSCWAFSATGSLEGQMFIKTKKLVSLSEQNLVDCSNDEGNHGCAGGLMDQAFQYVYDNNGIATETSYPYEAQDATCRYNAKTKGASDRGYVDIPSERETKLQAAVATKGPISVAIDASYPSFQMYKHGVYKEEWCSTDDVDHGMLVVGYGNVTKGGAYWLVKNSWGTQWGMQGYIMMARNYWNMCGIATMASFPSV